MAAEIMAAQGVEVTVYDAMPSVGRKFLLAGRGGLNLTHSEPLEDFIPHYGDSAEWVAGLLHDFGPDQIRQWAASLGIDTFVGTSGRVFPNEMKAAPLLRAWVKRLRALGVRLQARHRWQGFTHDGRSRFTSPSGEEIVTADAMVLALGGASWPRLGSDGAWVPVLSAAEIAVEALKPANCGLLVAWTEHMSGHFGTPLKNIALTFAGRTARGELTLSSYGLEGNAVYALCGRVRDAVAAHGSAVLTIDLKADSDEHALFQRLRRPRGRLSLSSWLRKTINLTPAQVAVLREGATPGDWASPEALARRLKAVPLTILGTRPIAEAISSAGGVSLAEVDDRLMLRRRPGLFVAGEMLDWEAPTGGYLMTGCLSTGHRVGNGVLAWLEETRALTGGAA
jgi:hypothetical protein